MFSVTSYEEAKTRRLYRLLLSHRSSSRETAPLTLTRSAVIFSVRAFLFWKYETHAVASEGTSVTTTAKNSIL